MHKKITMCDLIDLNSPDKKGLLTCRLASPLIPVPTDTTGSNYNNRITDTSSLVSGKRDSLENNPFDMVLHKTTEYIQKKDDPFEVALEKALRIKRKKDTKLRTYSVEFTDDYTLKRRKSSQNLKINKTLDESLINEELNQRNVADDKIQNENVAAELDKFDTLSDNLKSVDISVKLSFSDDKHNVLPSIEVQDINLSILNQSIMNDTLFEADKDVSSRNQNKFLTGLETGKDNIEHIPTIATLLQVPNLRRSFSQGDNVSPKKTQHLDHISMVEKLRTNSESRCSVSSTLDILNDGFLKSRCSGSSVFSSLSNISSITKLNSISSTTNLSMMLSSDTFNRTFLESCSSEKSDSSTKLNEKASPIEGINSASLPSKNLVTSVANTSTKTRSSMSDLTDRFNKLKARASELHVSENTINEKNQTTSSFSNDIKECVTVMKEKEESDTDNRLIDIDIFSPQMNYGKDQYKSSISDTSSDSVFLDESKVNKSILHEAKLLARTFEELALRTSSGSSIDDLITNNPLWTSELLPAFDDEIDNLIELPISPDTSNANPNNKKVMERTDNVPHINRNRKFVANISKENIKDLEMELIAPIPTEKRVTAATLLLDLKKLINTEIDTEANKLLENLEKVLGINWDNNTELLTTYLNVTNNLAKSPQKSNSNLEIKNVAENNMEFSQENNVTDDLIENIEESAHGTNMNINDSNLGKCSTNNQKCLKEINRESKEMDEELKIRNGRTGNENKGRDFNVQTTCNVNTSCTTESNDSVNEKVAIELLTNLSKLLSGQTEEHSTINLLRNLGRVLNFHSNNCNINEKEKTNKSDVDIHQTPKKANLKYENKSHSSVLSKSVNRYSLELESKKQPVAKPFMRRSISVSQTPPIRTAPSPLMSKGKSTSQLREVTKRFSSDPGLASTTVNKKSITNSNKNDLQKDIGTKTIPTLDIQKEKTTMIGTVKSKLKNKIDINAINKKGPMKAILPVGSMRKRESISRKVIPSTETITPPKVHKIISSTPNSTDNRCPLKKSSRPSKPVASSTPDAENSKARKVQSQKSKSSKKRNFGCDISPVTTRVNDNNSNGVNNSSKRFSKLLSPKKTPKLRPVDSSIPRCRTPPVNKRLNSSCDINQYERTAESPQRSLYKMSSSQNNSPISLKKNGGKIQQSPLRDSNKIMHKVKPVNLISKLRRHSIGTNVTEKENNYM
ncbi:PREDICTED: uncharacterized protein LOC107188384 [Dufourea novaeangliae]|uniref:uncharacterized protein LOC107188384 n=1 Tax=Dufourea novaeangliae TaxID=178035 RepID=UPI000767170C|nr:PREDICTED: uncharacterized protein LOC107188384 [Dufourea novaeangliae]